MNRRWSGWPTTCCTRCRSWGPDLVGIGSDFDGLPMWSEAIPADVSHLDDLFQVLDRRGVDRGTLAKIAGENFLRLLPA